MARRPGVRIRKVTKTPTVISVPPPQVGKKTAKGAVEATGRYVICPASNILHETRFVPIKESGNRLWFKCPCDLEATLPQIWSKDLGYSHKEASDYAIKGSGIVCGY